MKLINVVGINDENKIVVDRNSGTLKALSFRIEGNSDLLQNLKSKGVDISMLILGGERFSLDLSLPKYIPLFNSIGMAEGNGKSLAQLMEIVKQISNPVINHPKNVLGTARDSIGKTLASVEGIIVPQCYKITPVSIEDVKRYMAKEQVEFPFLFRPEVEYGISTLLKIETFEEMHKLECFAFNGENVFYMTQFREFISKDGIYRKMRFVIIGDEVIPRHLILSHSWQIHIDAKEEENLLKVLQKKEEMAFLGKIDLLMGKRLMSLKHALGLDYFGVDCGVDAQGKLLIFEANPFSMLGTGREDSDHLSVIEHTYDTLNSFIVEKYSEKGNNA